MPGSEEFLADGTFIVNKPVRLPEILDILIVGGGPAGTAAAFHAKELGMQALVIDFDDIMKRIRNYSKEKPILPDFGGGDKMKFPKGGKLIEQLVFEPIFKDEMCMKWKKLYKENNIAAQIGVELLGLERQKDGVWQAHCFNHKLKQEHTYNAKHVIISLGGGEPRTFDIPGNCEGIQYRLVDSASYVGSPALVIGGGTSAAEAVLAISNHKIKLNDPTAIYWSYRGDRMPKVSRALSEVFFEAYVFNGNIRYYPVSEPEAVVTAEDHQEYLSIRVDRKKIDGRPNEATYLEFPKEKCIACIGQDLPEKLLNHLGIFLFEGGPKMKKRVTVNRYLESQQPNVYLIGDLLSKAYLETDDFQANPETFREIKHRGNIKSALRDGVYVTEVIAQKLHGKKEINVELEFIENDKPAEVSKTSMVRPIIAEEPPEESGDVSRSVDKNEAYLTRVLPDGVEENEYEIEPDGVLTIGRLGCDLTFENDSLMSAKHASILHTAEGYFLRDDGSTNGVYLKVQISQPRIISEDVIIHAGRQKMKILYEGDKFHVSHYGPDEEEISRSAIREKTMVIGRDAPDIILDKNDMTLSRRHLGLSLKNDEIYLKDLGSANGTYIRIKDKIQIEHNDEFRAGQQNFRFYEKSALSPIEEHGRTSTFDPPNLAQEVQPAQAPAVAPAKSGKPVIIFKNIGKQCEFQVGQSICEIAKENNVKIKTDCLQGICGSDPIRILSGGDFLNPVSNMEADTLEDLCDREPGEYRLACVARPNGPIEVEIIK